MTTGYDLELNNYVYKFSNAFSKFDWNQLMCADDTATTLGA